MERSASVLFAFVAMGMSLSGTQAVFPSLGATPTEIDLSLTRTESLTLECNYTSTTVDINLLEIGKVSGNVGIVLATVNDANPSSPTVTGDAPAGSTATSTVFNGRPASLILTIPNPLLDSVAEYFCRSTTAEVPYSFHDLVEVTLKPLDQAEVVSLIANLSSEAELLINLVVEPPEPYFNETLLQRILTLEEVNANLTVELNATNEAIDLLQVRLAGLLGEIGGIEELAQNHSTRIDELEVLINQTGAELLQDAIVALAEQVQIVSNETDDLFIDLLMLEQQHNETVTEMEANKAQLDSLLERKDNLTSELEATNATITGLDGRLDVANCRANGTDSGVAVVRDSLYVRSNATNNGTTYVLSVYSPATFLKAEDACNSMGGYLAEIDTVEEWDFVLDFLNPIISEKQYILTGFRFVNGEWVNRRDNTTMAGFLFFSPAIPVDEGMGEFCSALAFNLFGSNSIAMDDVPCDFIKSRSFEWIHGYLCEVPAATVEQC